MKKVAIIGTVGIPSRYGGFETLAHHLTDHLKDEFDFTVYCSKKAYVKGERPTHFNQAKLVYLPFDANGVQSIIYDIISIFHALIFADTLLVLGVSGGVAIPFVRLFTKKKIIINIDGLEWRRSKWNAFAKRFLKFSERIAVKFSHADITDNEAIKKYTSINYKTLSHLIAYGGDHTIASGSVKPYVKKYPFLSKPYAFKVARIEPENNVHMILKAFSETKKTLVVVGNWDRSEYGIQLKKQYEKYENIILHDPVYGQEELDVIRRNSMMYIHGHSAGGTNPSLVEAMCLNLPVISFDVSYNRATTEDQAYYFKNIKNLVCLINKLESHDLIVNANKMFEIAKRRYQWCVIANKYKNLIYTFDYAYKKQHIKGEITSLKAPYLQKRGLAHLIAPTYYYQNEEI
ncbi:MAG: glycosyltransferase involved in cell wall biosynthesis [Glaciecola sp.]|jgi:glycosyltransferase involved in cell wall biosynthesis